MKLVYLDKKERVRAWFTPGRTAVLGTALLLVLFAPIWPDFVEAPFVLEAARRIPIRASVPGVVEYVAVREGEDVPAGALLLRMRNLGLESEAAQAAADLALAASRSTQASLRYQDFAAAEQERQRSAEKSRLVQEKLAHLSITSPVSGTIMTAHPDSLIGSSPDEGDFLLDIADSSELRARLYLPEFALHDIHLGASVRLLVPGRVRPLSATLSYVSPAAVPIADGLIAKQQLQGLNAPRFYLGGTRLHNDGGLREGMVGLGKIFVQRRSLAGFALKFLDEIVSRKVW